MTWIFHDFSWLDGLVDDGHAAYLGMVKPD
jgi:hypothetical protein